MNHNATSFVCSTGELSLNMSSNTFLYTASICAATCLALVLKWRHSRTRPPYPPGPARYPLIGSVLELPRDVPIFKAFVSIAEKFSRCLTPTEGHHAKGVAVSDTDVLYMKLFSKDLIILNSSEAVSDLLEKRSNIYSDRVSHIIKHLARSH